MQIRWLIEEGGARQMVELLSRQVSDTLKASERRLKVAMNTLTFLTIMYAVKATTLDQLAGCSVVECGTTRKSPFSLTGKTNDLT